LLLFHRKKKRMKMEKQSFHQQVIRSSSIFSYCSVSFFKFKSKWKVNQIQFVTSRSFHFAIDLKYFNVRPCSIIPHVLLKKLGPVDIESQTRLCFWQCVIDVSILFHVLGRYKRCWRQRRTHASSLTHIDVN
jgi:hypothetical protein